MTIVLFLVVGIIAAAAEASSAPSASYLLDITGFAGTFNKKNLNLTKSVSKNIGPSGEVLTIGEDYGLYPKITNWHGAKNVWCNGGIVQRANISAHVAQLKSDLHILSAGEWNISDPRTYEGVAIMDYEKWHYCWDCNLAPIYKRESIAYARKQDPSLPSSGPKTEAKAKELYEKAVKKFLKATFAAVREVFPRLSGLGSFGYPQEPAAIYNNPNNDVKLDNGELVHAMFNITQYRRVNEVDLAWLYQNDTLDLLAPSIYLHAKSGSCQGCVPASVNEHYLNVSLDESDRVSNNFAAAQGKSKLIKAPYVWYRYCRPPFLMELITSGDAVIEMSWALNPSAATLRPDYLILWGDDRDDSETVFQWFKQNSRVFSQHNGHGISSEEVLPLLPLEQKNSRRMPRQSSLRTQGQGGSLSRHRLLEEREGTSSFPSWKKCHGDW